MEYIDYKNEECRKRKNRNRKTIRRESFQEGNSLIRIILIIPIKEMQEIEAEEFNVDEKV